MNTFFTGLFTIVVSILFVFLEVFVFFIGESAITKLCVNWYKKLKTLQQSIYGLVAGNLMIGILVFIIYSIGYIVTKIFG